MWGGWYDDPDYMALMEKMRELCQNGMDAPDTDVAVFIDEKAVTKGVSGGVPMTMKAVRETGLCGTPNDAYLMSDFDAVFDKYKACIFIEPAETELSCECAKKAISSNKALKRFTVGSEIHAEDIRKWLKDSLCDVGVNRNAVVYRSKKYLMLYTAEDGEYDFCDRGNRSFTDLFEGKKIDFPANLKKAKCLLFERS